jgi:polysaccharide export outer membrane protein
MKRISGLAVLAVLLFFPMNSLAGQAEYRLGPGDRLNFQIWTWGNEPIQEFETTIRPDGKVALAFSLVISERYRLDSGDILSIGVWGYEELQSSQTVVRPDGRIAFPLAGEIMVRGLTPAEFNRQLTVALRDFVKDPQVTVNVVKFRSVPLVEEFAARDLTIGELTGKVLTELAKYSTGARVVVSISKYRTTRVYVLGEVYRPGLCEIEKSHNLLDAIGSAGGFTKYANRKKVYLIRSDQPDHYTEINLDRILKKGDLSQNYTLNDGDTLYLSRSGLDFARDILPFITAAYQIHHMDD